MLTILNRRGWTRLISAVAGRRLGCRHGQLFSQRLEAWLPAPAGIPANILRQVVSAFSFPAFRIYCARTPALRVAILTTTLALLFFCGCTLVPCNHTFPKLEWYWSAEAKACRQMHQPQTNSPVPAPAIPSAAPTFHSTANLILPVPPGQFVPLNYPCAVSNCFAWAMYCSTDLVNWQQLPFHPDSLDSNGAWIVHIDPTQPKMFFRPQIAMNQNLNP